MKNIKAREGFVLTQSENVKIEERWFATEISGADVNSSKVKEITAEEMKLLRSEQERLRDTPLEK